jgi:hypothetical protein
MGIRVENMKMREKNKIKKQPGLMSVRVKWNFNHDKKNIATNIRWRQQSKLFTNTRLLFFIVE